VTFPLGEFQRQLAAIARDHPDVLGLSLGHPVVAAALDELTRQTARSAEDDSHDFICPVRHPAEVGGTYSHWCETGTGLFLHLITCPHFRAQHVEVSPPVLPVL
jgi:hypothetical protein